MTDLIETWKKKRKGLRKSHKQLLKRLERKTGTALDDVAEELHEEAFTKVSCLDCANCCSTIPPLLIRSDINRISKYLGMKTGDFEAQYVDRDDDGDYIINATPCPFLGKDNYCSIYEVRPRACSEYPHADGTQFSKRLGLHEVNAQYCPAVFDILESMKTKFGTDYKHKQ